MATSPSSPSKESPCTGKYNGAILRRFVRAIEAGGLAALKAQIQSGADLKAKEDTGYTVLMWICENQPPDAEKMVEEMLLNGADANARTTEGMTPLLYICGTPGQDPVSLPRTKAQKDIFAQFMKWGCNVNCVTAMNETPLIAAARSGDLHFVETLLERKLDVNARKKNGETALLAAARGGHLDIIRLLLDNGANVDVTTDAKEIPLTLAGESGNVELVKLLIAKGAKGNAKFALSRAQAIAETKGSQTLIGAMANMQLKQLRRLNTPDTNHGCSIPCSIPTASA